MASASYLSNFRAKLRPIKKPIAYQKLAWISSRLNHLSAGYIQNFNPHPRKSSGCLKDLRHASLVNTRCYYEGKGSADSKKIVFFC